MCPLTLSFVKVALVAQQAQLAPQQAETVVVARPCLGVIFGTLYSTIPTPLQRGTQTEQTVMQGVALAAGVRSASRVPLATVTPLPL
jgi:hypothetical protein